MIIGRGSPKFAFMQAKSTSKRVPPKGQGRGTSPKVIVSQKKTTEPRAEQARASWNSTLEKGLVDVMHENMNSFCRTQNGWSPEGWKRIVQGFRDKFPHILFSKGQIQDKEKELKRDYRCLKDARTQSGTSWDEKLGMIIADDPAVWNNIIHSFPRAKKFRNKHFPIFEALGELYDGQTAEGLLNFSSLKPTNTPDQSRNTEDDIVTQVGADDLLMENNQDDLSSNNLIATSEHAEMEVSNQLNQRRQSASTSRKPPEDKREKNPKRHKQNGNVVDVMEKYIELRRKQAEEEMTRDREATKKVDEFSIKNCIAVLSTMKELSPEENAQAFSIFKDARKREIIISADPLSRILWLRL